MRRLKLASGLKPLTKAERKRLFLRNSRRQFPCVSCQRLEMTVRALELSRHIPEKQQSKTPLLSK